MSKLSGIESRASRSAQRPLRTPTRHKRQRAPFDDNMASRHARREILPATHGPGADYDFESEAAAIKEDLLRAKQMKRALPKPHLSYWLTVNDRVWLQRQYDIRKRQIILSPLAAKRLIRKLEEGAKTQTPHPTLASFLAMRGIRKSVVNALLEALDEYDDKDLRTFTIINRHWIYTPEQLEDVSAATIKAQLVSHLKRGKVTDLAGPFIAFLHGEFDPVSRTYVLHFHGVTTKAKADLLDNIKRRWGYVLTPTRAAPIKRLPVTNRPRQFSYLLKAYWPAKGVRLLGEKIKRDRRVQRIPERFHSQYLLWLDRHSLSDITVMTGVWSPRLKGTDAMKKLYFVVFKR